MAETSTLLLRRRKSLLSHAASEEVYEDVLAKIPDKNSRKGDLEVAVLLNG